jgi:hypothetical protein
MPNLLGRNLHPEKSSPRPDRSNPLSRPNRPERNNAPPNQIAPRSIRQAANTDKLMAEANRRS